MKQLKYGMLMTPDNAQRTHDGLKTVTRRRMNPQPDYTDGTLLSDYPVGSYGLSRGRLLKHLPVKKHQSQCWSQIGPRYLPGMIVSIKEYHWRWGHKVRNAAGNWHFVPMYHKVHDDHIVFNDPKWGTRKPSAVGYHGISGLFLPYDLARTHVLIEEVRPEKLQEITREDCFAEGIVWETDANGINTYPCGTAHMATNPNAAFRWLWDSINPKHPWADNDWVWPYKYRRVDKPTE